jgi:predicted regulator of amino acid metabolism with ACT domain
MDSQILIAEIARLWNSDRKAVKAAIRNLQEEMNLDYETALIRVLVEAEREAAPLLTHS